MTGLLCDPAQEKEVLYIAIDALHKQWGKPQMAKAYRDLRAAVARAEQALSVLAEQQDRRGIAFKIHVLGLASLVMVAREEIQRAERFALAVGEREAAAHPFLLDNPFSSHDGCPSGVRENPLLPLAMTPSRTRHGLVTLTLRALWLRADSSLTASSYTGHLAVYFSPSGGGTEAVVQALAAARVVLCHCLQVSW